MNQKTYLKLMGINKTSDWKQHAAAIGTGALSGTAVYSLARLLGASRGLALGLAVPSSAAGAGASYMLTDSIANDATEGLKKKMRYFLPKNFAVDNPQQDFILEYRQKESHPEIISRLQGHRMILKIFKI